MAVFISRRHACDQATRTPPLWTNPGATHKLVRRSRTGLSGDYAQGPSGNRAHISLGAVRAIRLAQLPSLIRRASGTSWRMARSITCTGGAGESASPTSVHRSLNPVNTRECAPAPAACNGLSRHQSSPPASPRPHNQVLFQHRHTHPPPQSPPPTSSPRRQGPLPASPRAPAATVPSPRSASPFQQHGGRPGAINVQLSRPARSMPPPSPVRSPTPTMAGRVTHKATASATSKVSGGWPRPRRA